MEKEYISSSAAQTRKLGKSLAEEIISFVKNSQGGKRVEKENNYGRVKNFREEKAFFIALKGELGGGKTTFLQGFAKELGVKEKILSPTFVILKRFQILARQPADKFQVFYHIDCYRIQKPEELLSLGFKKILSNPKNIIAVEWAERIKKIMPKDILKLKFEFIDGKTRRIIRQ